MNTVQPIITKKAKGVTQYTWRFLRAGDMALPIIPEGLSSSFGAITVEGTSTDNTTLIKLLGTNNERDWYTVKDIQHNEIQFTDSDKGYREFCSAFLGFRPTVISAGSGSTFEVTVVVKAAE